MAESDVLRGLRRKLAIVRRERDFAREHNKQLFRLITEAWARNDILRGQLEAYRTELERLRKSWHRDLDGYQSLERVLRERAEKAEAELAVARAQLCNLLGWDDE
jgi:hypothetical protein